MRKRGAFLGRSMSAAVMGVVLMASASAGAQSMPDYRGDNPPTGRAPIPSENVPQQNADIRGAEAYGDAQSNGLASYGPLDQAYAFIEAIGSSPPDFGFRFDGEDAWGWESQSGDIMLMQRDGDDTIQYFYEPGEDAPYLVRTNAQSYAYADDSLYAAYDSRGGVIAGDENDAQAEEFFHRGIAIYQAANTKTGSWNDTMARDWSSSVGIDYTLGNWGGWDGWWRSYPGWQSYYDWDNYYSYDRTWRGDYGRNFYNWRRRGQQGRPPARPTRPPITRPIPGHPAGPIAGSEQPQYGQRDTGGWRGNRWQNGAQRPRGDGHQLDGQQRPNRPGWRRGTTGRDPSIVAPTPGNPNQPPMITHPGRGDSATPSVTRPRWQRPEGQPTDGQRTNGQRPDRQRPNWQRPDGQVTGGRQNWQRPTTQQPAIQNPQYQRPQAQPPAGHGGTTAERPWRDVMTRQPSNPQGQAASAQRPQYQRPQAQPQVQAPSGHGGAASDRAWRDAMARQRPAESPRPQMEQPPSHPQVERPRMERPQMERPQPRAQVERPASPPPPRVDSPRRSEQSGRNPHERVE